uniref:Uncharacterized protein n=1 Tax=Timema douglasi TaxID=61478 RepID=A0A7R8VDA3_TIMDO|nr:unnamed protein product [Timema douglasi]
MVEALSVTRKVEVKKNLDGLKPENDATTPVQQSNSIFKDEPGIILENLMNAYDASVSTNASATECLRALVDTITKYEIPYENVVCVVTDVVYLCEYLVDLVEYLSTLEEVTAALKYFQDMSNDKVSRNNYNNYNAIGPFLACVLVPDWPRLTHDFLSVVDG